MATDLTWRAAALLGCVVLAGCGRNMTPSPWPEFSGDAARGAVLIREAGCGACHEIPGIPDAVGTVGPPLIHIGSRTAIAGLLPNTPDALVRWVRTPQAVLPGNAMPDPGLSVAQARDVAAYLHRLR